MAAPIYLADYKRIGPEAVQALLNFELAPGVTVHAASWVFAMSDAEYELCDEDPDQMAELLSGAGLAYFSGNDDQPAVLVLQDEALFRRRFRSLPCKEAAMNALGSGILIRKEVARCV